MSRESIDAYWEPSFETLYQAHYQELASEALIRRWQRIDIGTGILVAATASGSAFAGWALWNQPHGKVIWAGIAGIASLASILHSVMGVPGRVKEQDELRRVFCELRVDLETFRQQLAIGLDSGQASGQYAKLRERLAQCMGRTRPDIGYTIGLRNQVQDQVNKRLKEYING